jgi:hypothetical protein
MKVKSYNQFILESNENNDDLFYSLVEEFWKSDLLGLEEKMILEKEVFNPISYLIQENFYDKLKNRFNKAKQVATDLTKRSKDSLEKIVDAAKTAMDFINKVKEFLSEQIKLILTNTKDKIKNKLKINKKFLSETKSKLSSDRSAFLGELEMLKDVVNFYQTKLYVSLEKQIVNAMTKFLTSEDKEVPISEKIQIIKEGNNMIDKLVHGLNSIPPFSWIDKLQKIGEKGANFIIEQLSFITEKLGGPSFILPITSVLIGIAFEYNVKGLIKNGLLDVVSMLSLPFVTPIIKMVGFIATMIASYELIVAISRGYEEEEKLHNH